MKYTPAPWGFFKRDRGIIDVNQIYDGNKDGVDIATIYSCTDNSEANAHLIAAAPLMYEALKIIARDSDSMEIGSIAQAVINEAEGK